MNTSLRINKHEACRAYFATFLPQLQGELLLPGLRSLECRVGVKITDMNHAAWVLAIEAGRLKAVLRGPGITQCDFCLDAATLMDVATGLLAPDEAFFDLRIEIEGDTALGLQLSTVLEPFFQQFPFRPDAA